MRKISILFSITALDTSNKFEVEGELGSKGIRFVDNEGNRNYIVFHKDNIEYLKKGNVHMKYIFNQTEQTQGEYTVSGYTFNFNIITTDIVHHENYLMITYDLYQNNELVNKTKLELKYTFLKEEQ